MPAATTHVLFTIDVYRYIHEDVPIVNKHMFYLGSQGPDILFFSRASLFPGSLHKYGNLLHSEKVPEVISYFDKYAKDDVDLQSYIQGYICHYALDSTAHPLISAYAKYLHDKDGVHEGSAHVASEAEIDVWMLNHRNRDIDSYDVYRYLKVDVDMRNKLATMYHNMFIDVFGIDIATSRFDSGIAEVHTWTKFIRPKKGRYALLYNFERTLSSHFITAMMLYGKKVGKIINLTHDSYPLAFDETKTISASFPELYGRAIYKAIDLLKGHEANDFTLDFNGKPIQNN